MNLKSALFASLTVPVLLFLVACGGGDDDDSDATSPTPTGGGSAPPVATAPISGTTAPTGATPAAGTGSNAEIAAIISAYNNIRSVRAQVVIEVPGVPSQTMAIESVMPDKFHITSSAAVPGAPALEIILIGNDSYIKVGPTWTKQSIPGQASALFDFRTISTSVQSLQASGVAKGGTANVGGKTCQLYTVTSSGASQEICIADNLPVRVVSTAGGVKTTITFTDFNANITIVPPI